MNKEELTRALKYTEEKHRNDRVDTGGTNISLMCSDVLRVLENCIEIPDNATNGDVIMAMFPNAKWWVNEDNEVFTDMPWKPEKCVYFDLDWWNTPYKKEVEE